MKKDGFETVTREFDCHKGRDVRLEPVTMTRIAPPIPPKADDSATAGVGRSEDSSKEKPDTTAPKGQDLDKPMPTGRASAGSPSGESPKGVPPTEANKKFPDNRAKQPRTREPWVVATWEHRVHGKGNSIRSGTMKLYSNGRIGSPNSVNTWTKKNRLLILYWPNSQAPGGVWRDVCIISTNGKTYSGKNQNGVGISGVKLSE